MATTIIGKFILLLWKNFLLLRRNPRDALLELVLPLILIAILVVVRIATSVTEYKETRYEKFDLDDRIWIDKLKEIESHENLTLEIAYTPQSEYYDRIIKRATARLSLTGKPHDTTADLEKYIVANQVLVGVVFRPHSYDIKEQPKSVTYELRYPSELRTAPRNNWETNSFVPRIHIGGPRNKDDADGGIPPGYLRESYLTIQNAIAYAMFEEKPSSVPKMQVARLPYPKHKLDLGLSIMQLVMAQLVSISFIFLISNIVRHITWEKEQKLKEVMKIMGLPNWLHWTAWFARSLMTGLVIVVVITFCFTFKWRNGLAIFTHSNWFIVFTFLLIYLVSAIMFCFLISSIFAKAVTASTVSGLVWFVIQLPYVSIARNPLIQTTMAVKLPLCLLTNSAMGFGLDLITDYELEGIGIQWDNIWSKKSPDDHISLGIIELMMIFCALLYLLLALYFEKLFPGDYGIPEKWYFPFTKSFWIKDRSRMYDEHDEEQSVSPSMDNFEKEPDGLKIGIQIKNLRKVYPDSKLAVQGLRANMYEDQITVLLGHNGAGKTTTMCMLTGMFPPTSGTAIINGCDIRRDMQGVRRSLSICPQHDILFDELTVKQHIVFFCKLKGLKDNEIEEEIEKYVDLLEMRPKINARSKTLSGGMKRKLSIGVALCGGTKVVLLDEPTAGMDPAARRALWDVLQREKKGRTILLSTHFMDEADILGDRIAILSGGELICCGSPFFLKKKYGIGYHLICEKTSECNSNEVTKVIAKYIPSVKIESEIGNELSYQLPDDASKKFKDLFSDLEDQKDELGVLSFGVSMTTLEEVFLKTGADLSAEDDVDSIESMQAVSNAALLRSNQFDRSELLTGLRLKISHVKALIKKKLISTHRHWIVLFFQLAIPSFIILVSILTTGVLETSGEPLKALRMNLRNYHRPEAILSRSAEIYKNDFLTHLAGEYGIVIKSKGKIAMTEDDLEDYVLDLSEKTRQKVISRLLVAASISAEKLIVYFNNQFYHSAPLALNLMHQAIIITLFGHEYSVNVVNHPLPYSIETNFKMLDNGNNTGFQTAFNTGFSMTIVASLFVIFCIKERVSRAKLLQFVSGVGVFTFWAIAYIWDFLVLSLCFLLTVITIRFLDIDGWTTFSQLSKVFLILLMFGLAVLPQVYIASLVFSVPTPGYTNLATIFFFTGIGPFLTVFMLGQEGLSTHDIADKLTFIFYIIPQFNLLKGLENFNKMSLLTELCDEMCQLLPACNEKILCQFQEECCSLHFFTYEKSGLNWSITFFIISAISGFSLLLAIEYQFLNTLIYYISNLKAKKINLEPTVRDDIDDDVQEEARLVHELKPADYKNINLVVKDMCKYYNTFLAVNRLCVHINHSECFGLLGVNGAGKTTTFKMLTGDLKMSSGDAYLRGISHQKHMHIVHRHIGYCPQFDALLDSLTGRETLDIFCLLRGVRKKRIKKLSEYLADGLGFSKHLDKKVGKYSGGNKRKLSTAIALIGNPVMIYLDEPTTGMDPAAKRVLWNMVCKVRDSGKSIVLTSHSMDECEALCTRLAIMVNGEFKCLGSSQRLKSKFSKGYILTIKLEGRDSDTYKETRQALEDYIYSKFTGVELREEFGDKLTYYIADKEKSWSTMFGIIEDAKEDLKIKDYSVNQTSLEEVFLSFTKYQVTGDEN